MSALSDYILTKTPLHYWQVVDRSGTTLPDSGSLNLPMTVTNPVSGPAITADAGPSLRGDGVNTRAVTGFLPGGGTSRFAANASYTVGCFLNLRTSPTGSTRVAFGRTPQSLRVTTTRSVFANGAGSNQGTVIPMTIDETFLAVMTWNGSRLRLHINGRFVVAEITAGLVSDVSDPWELLSLGGVNLLQADVAHAFVLSGVMGAGVQRKIYELGHPSPMTLNPLLATQVSNATTLASPAIDGGCFTCSGDMHEGEPRVGADRHAGCYGAVAGNVTPPVLTVSSAANAATPYQIRAMAGAQIEENLKIRAFKIIPAQTPYHDGTVWQGLPAPGTNSTELMGSVAGAAGLYHAIGTPANHWLLRYAKSVVEQLIAVQATNPVPSRPGIWDASGTPVYGLGMAYLLETYLWLRPRLDAATRTRWLAAFNAAGDDWVKNERLYYINGNVECGETLSTYLMWLVTGDPVWQARYEVQLSNLIAPASNVAALGGSALSKGFGWRWRVEPTGAGAGDGSNAKGYFAESKNDTNHPELIGYDVIYTQVQQGFIRRLYDWSNDSRLIKYINAMSNLLLDSINTGTAAVAIKGPAGDTVNLQPWQIDGRVGIRNPTFIRVYSFAEIAWLQQRPELRATNPIPPEWPVRQWPTVMTEYRNNRGTNGTFIRALGETFIGWMQADRAHWPALRG